MTQARKRIGQLLCERSYLAECQLDEALARQGDLDKCPLGQILLELVLCPSYIVG